MDIAWIKHIAGGNIQRIIEDIWEISQGNERPGRLAYAYSDKENAIFNYIKSYIYNLNDSYSYMNRNLDIFEDPVGNLYISLDSDKDSFAACGSHVDSVGYGGGYDGVMGIAAALEVFRVLFEHNVQAKHGFRIIVFRAEESAATGTACLGSQIATGTLSLEKLELIQYGIVEKLSFHEVMKKLGYNWQSILDLRESPLIQKDGYQCYLEFHIEQGRVLEEMEKNIGIVDKGIGGARRYDFSRDIELEQHDCADECSVFRFSIYGHNDHSGGTPMNGDYRDDALLKSVDIIRQLLDAGGRLVTWNTADSSYNTISGEVSVSMVLSEGWEKQFDEQIIEIHDQQTVQSVKVWPRAFFDDIASVILTTEKLGSKYAAHTNGLITATITGLDLVNQDVVLRFDMRMLDVHAADDLFEELSAFLHQKNVKEQRISAVDPTFFDQQAIDDLSLIHEKLFNEKAVLLPSMPGHDARSVAKTGIPTAMIFSYCRDGVSHSPDEFVEAKAMEDGARLLGAGLVFYANR